MNCRHQRLRLRDVLTHTIHAPELTKEAGGIQPLHALRCSGIIQECYSQSCAQARPTLRNWPPFSAQMPGQSCSDPYPRDPRKPNAPWRGVFPCHHAGQKDALVIRSSDRRHRNVRWQDFWRRGFDAATKSRQGNTMTGIEGFIAAPSNQAPKGLAAQELSDNAGRHDGARPSTVLAESSRGLTRCCAPVQRPCPSRRGWIAESEPSGN